MNITCYYGMLIVGALTRVANVQAAELTPSQSITLDGSDWRIATDPENKGRDEKWFENLRPEAKPTPVPWVIQNIFPGYHGVAWYWREFKAPANPHQNGRYLLRFGAVDYLAEVWVNGQPVGGHEGGETPFTLDVTRAIRPGQKNLLAVRVLNPAERRAIDGYLLKQTPSGDKHDFVESNVMFNSGGIVESVEFLIVPAIRFTDLHVLPNWKTGEILVKATIHNAASPADVSAQFAVAANKGGKVINTSTRTARAENGDRVVEATLRVPGHRLWTTDAPFLYRVTATIQMTGDSSVDRQSVRCGFRDFRYENGYFRLNGKRIFLNGVYYLPYYPVTYTMPHDPELIRRDVDNVKKAGYNFVRITLRSALPQMLERCDEVGVLALEEHFGVWQMEDSPAMKSRWNRSIGEVILRDRNHASVVMWGLLNEMPNDPVFQNAVASLSMIRELDPSRIVVLNSGRFDGCADIGSLSNPGSLAWDGKSSDLPDIHSYPLCPLDEGTINSLRTCGKEGRAFLTEYGQCGTMDLPSELAQFKRLGHEQGDDALWYRRQMDWFMADWKRWRLNEIWKRPENYFTDGHRNYARIREPGETAFRSNPYLVAYSPTHLVADHQAGCGLTTLFREPKDPSLFDGARLATAPLRWCLFATPNNVYRGSRVRFEAVLSDQDTLKAGVYPVRVEVLGPDRHPVITREFQVRIGDSADGRERPFVVPAFDEVIPVEVPAGTYELVATMSDHKEIPGGRLTFYVDDPGAMPAMPREVTCWGADAALTNWLTQRGVKVLPFDDASARRQVIIAGAKPPAPGGAEAFGKLVGCIARGSVVVFLDPAVFANGKNGLRWLPVKNKQLGEADWCGSYYRSERWARQHPIFQGLPAGGMLDYSFYGSLISNPVISSFKTLSPLWLVKVSEEIVPPAVDIAEPSFPEPKLVDVVCGATRTSSSYLSGIHVATYELGSGRFILNTLNIAPNLGRHPVAERLLRNMLSYGAQDIDKPLADLPADFDKQLEAMGYSKWTRKVPDGLKDLSAEALVVFQSSDYGESHNLPFLLKDGVRTGDWAEHFAFHTAAGKNEHIIVELKNEGDIKEIYIDNSSSCPERAASMKLWVSADRVEWKEIWTAGGKAEPQWTIPVSVKAKFVKFGLQAEAEYFHLNRIRIYGN